MKILILTLLFTQSVLALDLFYHKKDIPEEYQQLSLIDKYSYSFVTKYCDNWSLAFSEITKSSLSEIYSIVGEFDYNVLKGRKKNLGRGQHLQILITSRGYYLGLDECFGKNKDRKDYFTMNLVGADAFGNASGLASGVVVWVTGTKLLKWIGSKVATKIKIPESVINKLKKGLYITAGVGISAIGIVNLNQKIDMKLKYIEALKGRMSEKILKLRDVEKDLEELAELSRDPSLSNSDIEEINELLMAFQQRFLRLEKQIEEIDEKLPQKTREYNYL